MGTILSTALANEPALSFPWIPIWFGIQQNITFLQWSMELSLFRSLSMKGLSSFVFLRDCRTWIESEWIINFSLLLVETSLSANFIAQIFAENMEASFGWRFFKVFLWKTAPYPVPLLLLEPSVKICNQFLSRLKFYIILSRCAGLHPSFCGLLHEGVLMFWYISLSSIECVEWKRAFYQK